MMLLLLIFPALAADLDTLELATGWMTARGGLQLERPRRGDPGELGFGAVVAWEMLPEARTAWWGTALGVNAGLSVVPTKGLSLDLAMTGYPWLTRADGDTGAALGDVRVGATAEIDLDSDVVALALRPTLRLPTGTAKWGLGDGDVGAGFDVLGEVAPSESFFIDGVVGVRAARAAVFGDEVVGSTARVGAGVGGWIVPAFGLGAEGTLDVPITLSGSTNLEIHGWAQWAHDSGFGLMVGGGAGLVEAKGAPTARVLGGISYTHAGSPPVYDRDADGIDDPNDRCPDDAEDRDAYQDDDGCPDRDNDADGVPDAADKCPRDAEDRDEFQDEDGCVDNDNDGDGTADMIDDCRDVVGSARAGGCPDADDDRVADAFDDCPEVSGTEERRGCPDESPLQEAALPTEIIVSDRVTFETATARLTPEAEGVLGGVLRTLVAHPEIKKVRVEGHTDGEGDADVNLRLSEARATAVVEWLVAHGVSRTRLEARGYGEEQPVDTNSTRAGRAMNRRVEFEIVE